MINKENEKILQVIETRWMAGVGTGREYRNYLLLMTVTTTNNGIALSSLQIGQSQT